MVFRYANLTLIFGNHRVVFWTASSAQEKDELVAVAGQPTSSLSGAGLMRYLQSAGSPAICVGQTKSVQVGEIFQLPCFVQASVDLLLCLVKLLDYQLLCHVPTTCFDQVRPLRLRFHLAPGGPLPPSTLAKGGWKPL